MWDMGGIHMGTMWAWYWIYRDISHIFGTLPLIKVFWHCHWKIESSSNHPHYMSIPIPLSSNETVMLVLKKCSITRVLSGVHFLLKCLKANINGQTYLKGIWIIIKQFNLTLLLYTYFRMEWLFFLH